MILSHPELDSELFDSLISAGAMTMEDFKSFKAPDAGRLFPVLVANADLIESVRWLQIGHRSYSLGRFPGVSPAFIENEVESLDDCELYLHNYFFPLQQVGVLKSIAIGVGDPRLLEKAKSNDWSKIARRATFFSLSLAETKLLLDATERKLKYLRGY
jgi:hypothetical protein